MALSTPRQWRRSSPTIRSSEDLERAMAELYGPGETELRIGPEAEAAIWCDEKRAEGRLDSEEHLPAPARGRAA